MATTPVPADLQSFEGKWVAIKGGRVVASAASAPLLARQLRGMGEAGQRARAQFVPPAAEGRSRLSSGERFHPFPYRAEELHAPQQGTGQRVERPTLDVQLSVGDLDFEMSALVDTGAPRCVFPRGCAEALGIDLRKAQPTRRHQLLGQTWDAVSVLVHLFLPPFVDLQWDTEVDFLLADWEMPFGLLGTEGFLDRWVVSFNRYHNYFVVQEVDDWDRQMPIDPFVEFQKAWDGWDRPD